MNASPRIALLPAAPRRRLVAATLLGALAVWLTMLFAQCLPPSVAGTKTSCAAVSATADMGAVNDITCQPPTCAATDDRPLLGDSLVPPAGVKVWVLLSVAVTLLLLTLVIPRNIPLPPQPLLPKRPRTLKYYALRI